MWAKKFRTPEGLSDWHMSDNFHFAKQGKAKMTGGLRTWSLVFPLFQVSRSRIL